MSAADIADGVAEEIGRTARFACGCVIATVGLTVVALVLIAIWMGWL